MKTQKAAKWLGIILVVIGILGFIPAMVPGGKLLGIFAVDGIGNVFHLLSGIVALLCAGGYGAAKVYFKIFGIVFGLVAVLGFINGASVLGIFPVNMPHNVLHAVIALLSLALGFRGSQTSSQSVDQI